MTRAHTHTSRPAVAALGLVVALALACRLGAVGSRLHVDEAYSWYVASAGTAHGFLTRLAASENTPPLFYLIEHLFAGHHPAVLRVPALVPGLLMAPVLYAMLRRRLGEVVAILSALVVAVDPFLVTYSDLARGFMLADLALLIALWGLLRLADSESETGTDTAARGAWALTIGAGVVALYTEYDSAIVLIAAAAVAAATRRIDWRRLLAAVTLQLATLLPWLPQIIHGQDQVGLTKLRPMNAAPSLPGLRDLVATLALGENGGTSSSAGRWLLCLVIIVALGLAGAVLRRRWAQIPAPGQTVLVIFAGTAVLSLAGYAAAGVVGIQIFSQRYLTILVALAAPVALTALTAVGARALTAAAALALVILGVGNAVRRINGEFEPDLTPVAAAARAAHPRTVLTNTPAVLFYLGSLHPVLDRPFNLGAGEATGCARPCVIVDDTRVPGGTPRPVSGTPARIGPYAVTVEP